jgi:undecaprenyl-diphosphatase
MPMIHLFVLALIQGVTELLPISSSGHLILAPELLKWEDQGVEMDIAMHVGSMLALVIYFWKDVLQLFKGFLSVCKFNTQSDNARFFLQLVVASIPAVIVGLVIHKFFKDALRHKEIIVYTMIFYGILLYVVDRFSRQEFVMQQMTYKNAIVYGIFQSLALVPGTSRSGITMTAGRLMGFQRREAARFGMIMAIPTIFGAGLLAAFDLYKLGNVELINDAMIVGALTFVVSYITIIFLMAWLRRSNFTPFVIYRLAFGGFLIYWFYFAH